MLVRDRMSKKLIAVGPRDPIARAVDLMHDHGVRHLPVLGGMRLIGILSDRDLRGVGSPAKPVADVMTGKPISISPDASVDEAAGVMRAHKISALPVLENRRVVGMLTTTDVLGAFVDLAGVAEPTTRIIVTSKAARGAGDTVRRIVHGCHGEIRWMHRQGRHLHLRLQGHRVDDIVAALEAAGLEVTAIVASARSAKSGK